MYECTNCGLLFEGKPKGSLGFPYCKRCFRKVWKNNYAQFYSWLRRGYLPLLILLFSILLIGCTKYIEIEKNITIETIKYINRNVTITEKCNITNNTIRYTYTGTTSRELELIRRIKFLEGQQNKWIINETECAYNITEKKLQNCKDKIYMHERDIEELEEELEDCEDEICEYNSSWC